MGQGYLGRSPVKIVEKETPQKGIYPMGDDARPAGAVTVPEGPLYLSNVIFKNNLNIQSVKLPNSILMIEPEGFSECPGLLFVSFPNKLTRIPENCFYNDIQLNSLTFPNTLEEIGNNAFYNCKNSFIDLIINTNSFKKIEDYAFSNAKALKEANIISDEFYYIGTYAFEDCENLKTFSFTSKNKLVIQPYAFKNTPLDSVQISNIAQNLDKTQLSVRAFAELPNITYVITTATTDYFFENCIKLKEAVIKDLNGDGKIGSYVFSGCDLLEKCTIPKGSKSIDLGLFKDNKHLKIINIPTQIVAIEEAAFFNCEKLNCEISLPNTLKTLGKNCFYNCKSLNIKNGDIPPTVTSIGEGAFQYAKGDDFHLFQTKTFNINNTLAPLTIGTNAFSQCGIENLNFLGETFVTLNAQTFQNSNLTNINFESEKAFLIVPAYTTNYIFAGTKINEDTMAKILQHMSPILTEGHNRLPQYLFASCHNLRNVKTFAAGCAGMFNGCANLETIEFRSPETDHEKQFYPSLNGSSLANCPKLKKVTLSKEISNIYSYVFQGDPQLSEIIIPEEGSSLRLEKNAFENYTGTAKIILPERVSHIGNRCFQYYDSNYPSSIKEIFIMNPNMSYDSSYNYDTFYFRYRNYAVTVYYTGNIATTHLYEGTILKKVDRIADNICYWINTGLLTMEGIGSTNDFKDIFQETLDNIINKDIDLETEIPKTQDDYTISIVTALPTEDISDSIIYRIKDSSNIFYSDYILVGEELIEIRTVPVFDKTTVKEVFIRKGRITALGDNLFKDCTNLSFVNIPSTVTHISASAFNGCSEDLGFFVERGSYAYNYALSKKAIIYTDQNTETLVYDYSNIPSFVDGTKFIVDTTNNRIVSGAVGNSAHIASEFIVTTPGPLAWVSITGYVSSENGYDVGGVYVSKEKRTISYNDISNGTTYNDGFWLMRQSGTSNILNTFTKNVDALTTYYLYFCYKKDSSGASGEDKIVIQNIKIGYYTKEELEYNYNEIEDKIPDEQIQG